MLLQKVLKKETPVQEISRNEKICCLMLAKTYLVWEGSGPQSHHDGSKIKGLNKIIHFKIRIGLTTMLKCCLADVEMYGGMKGEW